MFASQHSRALFALALALGALLAASGVARAQTQSTSIAVLPVVVHSMENRDYLRDGVADMLASRLGQYAGLGVIRVDDPLRAATDDAMARRTAREAGAEWVLYGSFTQFGEGASLDLRCLRVADTDAQPDPRAIFVQSGKAEQIIPQLSNLAERVAAHVHAGPRAGGADANREVSANRAAIEALRSRLDALEAQSAAGTPPAPEPVGAPPDIFGQALDALREPREPSGAADEDATP